MIGEDVTPISRLPYLHGGIPAARGDVAATWRPADRSHLRGMATIGEQAFACGDLPTCTVPSWLPEAMRWPPGDQASADACERCPRYVRTIDRCGTAGG